MQHNRIFKAIVIPVCIGIMVFITSDCAKKVVDSDRQNRVVIPINAKISAIMAASTFDHFLLTVEATDFEPITAPMEIQNTYLICEVVVPVGHNRHFTIEALDESGVAIYRGDMYADVPPSGAIELNISMSPAVPIVEIVPHFQRTAMCDPFDVDIYVHSIPDLRSISFAVTYARRAPMYFNSITPDPYFDSAGSLGYESGDTMVYIYASKGEGAIDMVDASGNAHIATLHFESYDDWGADTATAILRTQISSMWNQAGDSISRDSVHPDMAQINLYRPNFWSKSISSPGNDVGYSVIQARDGGFVIAGTSGNYSSDAYLVKTDSTGDTLWTRTYGGDGYDQGQCVAPTADGGYIITGSIYYPYHGTPDSSSDIYLIKTDASGNVVWEKAYGEDGSDYGYSVIQTADGGYLVAGTKYLTTSPYGYRVYLLKTNANGDSVWANTYAAESEGQARCVIPALDGGYLVAGYLGSEGTDAYLLKVDNSGDMIWDTTYVGNSSSAFYSVSLSNDGGYILTGYAYVSSRDVYLVKIDLSGNIIWEKTFDCGGSSTDYGYGVVRGVDNGYAIVGTGYPYVSNGYPSIVLIKTDESGNKSWPQRNFGTSGRYNYGYSIAQTADGYIITGYLEDSNWYKHIFLAKTRVNGTTGSTCPQ